MMRKVVLLVLLVVAAAAVGMAVASRGEITRYRELSEM